MRFESGVKAAVVVIFVCASAVGMAQRAPAATKGGWPVEAGGGVAAAEPDFPDGGSGVMLGGTLWVDYLPAWLPKKLYGLGIEAEGRDIDLRRSASEKDLREEAAGGGVVYEWMHWANLRPFAKYLDEFGNTDYMGQASGLALHQTRTVMDLGGGVEYRIRGGIWARAEYEYQRWPGFFYSGPGLPAPAMQPQGGTIGVMYSFRDRHR